MNLYNCSHSAIKDCVVHHNAVLFVAKDEAAAKGIIKEITYKFFPITEFHNHKYNIFQVPMENILFWYKALFDTDIVYTENITDENKEIDLEVWGEVFKA